jgi:integrase
VAHQIVVKPYGKTGTTHEIVLDPGTLAMLEARRSSFILDDGERHVCASIDADCPLLGVHERDLVFSRPDGNYLHPERFSKEFQRAQLRYNNEHPDEPIPIIGLHGLRHGWATLALEAGIPMKVVQDRLNHSSERITADIYTHVRRPLQSDAAHRVAELIRSPVPKQVE